MKKLFKLVQILFAFTLILFLNGCVNLEQKATINSDGSGTMKIKYWTKTYNILGDEIGTFGFIDSKVKSNFTSHTTRPSHIKIEKDANDDSLTVVTLDLYFTHINYLTDAFAFKNINSSWIKNGNEISFKYILLQDTANANQFGMSDYKLIYDFEFPSEVIATNGKKDGRKVSWNLTVADLKEEIEFTATIKARE